MNNEFNIVKILNFPTNGGTIEVKQNFTICVENSTTREEPISNDFAKLLDMIYGGIDSIPGFTLGTLFCEDENGASITLCNVSIVVFRKHYEKIYKFVLSQNGLIFGVHINKVEEIETNMFTVIFENIEQLKWLRCYDKMEFTTANNVKVKLTAESRNEKIKEHNFDITEDIAFYLMAECENELALFKMQEIVYAWRELIFLIQGFFPTFYWCTLNYKSKPIYICNYNKRFQESDVFCKNKDLYRAFKRIPINTVNWTLVFNKWVKLRKDIGVTIDIFISSIHTKDIFMEFYPYQMVTCIDGLACSKLLPDRINVPYNNKEEILYDIENYLFENKASDNKKNPE